MGLRLSATCKYSSCDKSVHAKGLCKAHYMQQLRGEELHELSVVYEVCQFTDCGREHLARGLCRGHYYQVYRGEELRPLRNDVVGYSAVHQRLKRERGLASDYACIKCYSSANEWAFIGNPESALYKNVIGRRGKETRLFFSRDLTQYEPMCHSCHVAYDMLVKSRGWQPWACA